MSSNQCRQCYSCHRIVNSLMSANCGHKICYGCVHSNKNTHKCASCTNYARNRMHSGNIATPVGVSNLSPIRTTQEKEKERSTKAKDTQNRGQMQVSPRNLHSSRKQLHKSSVNVIFSPSLELDPPPFLSILCKQHNEPLTMYCRNTKQLICSQCLCQRPRYNYQGQIMPLRGAEELLKRQNKAQRQEARIALSSVQNAQKVMKKNVEILRNAYDSHISLIHGVYQEVQRQLQYLHDKRISSLNAFFTTKLAQCGQILTDLGYLSSILKQHRDLSSKQPSSIQELVYAFTACKVVRNTVKNMDFQYLEYTSIKDLTFVEIRKEAALKAIEDMVKLKLQMPLRYEEKRRNKSKSNKSANKSKHEEIDDTPPLRHGYTQQLKPALNITHTIKKHQMSLCGNVGGAQMGQDERTVYKMLLKAKFKQ